MTKVCFVMPFAYSLFNVNTNYVFGGLEVRASLFGKELAKIKEFEVSFAVFDQSQKPLEYYERGSVYTDCFYGKQNKDTTKHKFFV